MKVIGKYRLDWVFAKSNLTDPLDTNGPYRLAPHYGETLTELNNNLHIKISDHEPNVVDIPFLEPSQWNETKKEETKISKIDKNPRDVNVNSTAMKN